MGFESGNDDWTLRIIYCFDSFLTQILARVSGCRMSNVGCRMSDVGCRMSDVGCRMSDVGCRMSDVG
ncbi:hypothetical protein EP331_10120, partial [bacterium]